MTYRTLYKTWLSSEKVGEGLQVEIVAPPADTVVSVAEAKEFCRVDFDKDDDLILRIIKAVTGTAEAFSNRAFLTQSIQAYWETVRDYVVLPRPPHRTVTLVESSTGGSWTTLAASEYQLSGLHTLKIRPRKSFSVSGSAEMQFRVAFEAGYGDHPEDVADAIKQAILDSVRFQYDNRGVLSADTLPICGTLTPLSKSLLQPFVAY